MLTITEALELSIVKWKFLVKHPEISDYGDSIKEKYPKEIQSLFAHCGLCDFYKIHRCGCLNCPLADGKVLCCEEYLDSQDGIGKNRSREDVLYHRYKMLDRLKELLNCAKKSPKGWLE